MSNRLQYETSPYLRQHAENPVNWYPWGEDAFRRAREEDKPVFLSIGYSTCHWCHVMAHESFEDEEIADFLNRHFISIKVDREERPDIDNVYMRVCQALTGGGGWPTSIFMTADQQPFFAGTYYPKRRRRGMLGFMELLTALHEAWEDDRKALLAQADEIIAHLSGEALSAHKTDSDLIGTAVKQFKRSFDRIHGGFGEAPKFPTPHNLLFLMSYYGRFRDGECLEMADKTLMRMYRGGLFDHIGGGFSRYSTDERFLVPHFEKMLYDNALLISAYCQAHAIMQDEKKAKLYLKIAKRAADYALEEMTAPHGVFCSAQDADSEGEEGKYYVFTPREIERVIGRERAAAFCKQYGISETGNFEGKSILNLLDGDPFDEQYEDCLDALYQYRKERLSLHLDDKILTAWNGLMIAAMCALYRESGEKRYLQAAKNANLFIKEQLIGSDGLYASFSLGKRGERAFLDDYAAYCYAQLALYRVTLDEEYLVSAKKLCRDAVEKFHDSAKGGFYFTEHGKEELFMRTKETYDGAIPSGNSLMAWNLARLFRLTGEVYYEAHAKRQIEYLSSEASAYPMGYSMFLCALLEYEHPGMKAVVVSREEKADRELPFQFPFDAALIFKKPSGDYPLKNGKPTFYICDSRGCLPPVNDLREVMISENE